VLSHHVWQRFEDAIFTSRRVALYAAVLPFCYVVFVLRGYVDRLWLIGVDGSGKSMDFVATWAAARLALSGQASAAYDLAVFSREQLAGVGRLGGDYAWAYPPTYFLVIFPLAFLPFAGAAVFWLFGTLALYAAAVRAILPRAGTVLA